MMLNLGVQLIPQSPGKGITKINIATPTVIDTVGAIILSRVAGTNIDFGAVTARAVLRE